MMEGSRGTASLRAMAPQWSLAGDKQLLSVLQNIHENVLRKCTEANAKLEEMTLTLNDASISLQNVNNKFMALSNTQFVESRVYDDDFETANETVKEEPKVETASKSEMQKIIDGLRVVERMHEPVHIVRDSDSDTDTDNCDSDDGDRVVLRLKDFYGHRPLPHTIGSTAWTNKWHGGLMPDDSDSDSSTSKPPKEVEEYSDSEPEQDFVLPDVTVSDVPTPVSTYDDEVPPKVANPAEVAAQLSRRLLAGAETIGSHSRNSWDDPAPVAARMNEPTTSRIFSDEPPPVDRWDTDTSEEEDIFAEIHKNKPYPNRDRAQSAARDLFGDDTDMEQNQKPVGGISVFGSIEGAEGIKTAIIKRSTRDELITDKEIAFDKDKPNEKDIFKDLFKDVKTKKDTVTTEKEEVKKKERKIDLFSDNIFDDIDDIFVNKVKSPSKDKKKEEKISIFDDIDDLFADVTTVDINKELPKKVIKQDKGLFDSDDDLFSENTSKIVENKIKSKVEDNNILKENSDLSFKDSKTKGLHNDEKIIESNRDLNNDKIKSDNQFDNNHNENVNVDVAKNVNENKDVANKEDKSIKIKNSNQNEQNVNVKSSLFDDDEEIDDLFQTSSKNSNKINKNLDKINKNSNEINKSKETKDVFDVIDNEEYNSNVLIEPLDSFSNQTDKQNDNFTSEVVENINSILNREIGNKTNKTSELNVKTDSDNKENIIKQSDTLIHEPHDSDYNDIFNDQPPEFEKPSEPKKSKNVNALFDDDSDDEALFFKKNDATLLDDRPDFSSDHNNLFGIFHDEPPALDVDFVQKSTDDVFSDSYDTLFSSQPIYSVYSDEGDIRNKRFPSYKNTKDLSKETKNSHESIKSINVDLTKEKITNIQQHHSDKIINASPEYERTTKKNISSDLDISNDDDMFNYISKETSNKIEPDRLKYSDIGVQLKNKDGIDEKIEDVLHKIEKKTNNNIPPVPHFDISDDELFSSASNFKEKEITDSNKEEVVQREDNLKSDYKIDTNKSIGKLKPINIKINVNTLLPGASPKKVPKSDETDGQKISVQSNEESNADITLKNEPSIIKSVNFEEDSNANMLDNKLSKERAKIQIKRRPSTRKARREAVRRSAIDIVHDSTDNSSSIDDKPNDDVNVNRQSDNDSDMVTTTVIQAAHDLLYEAKDEVVASDRQTDNNDVITNTHLDKDADKTSLRDEANIKTLEKESREDKEIGLTHKSDITRSNEVVTKVTRTVYILNDEDIFSTSKDDDTKNVKSSNKATLKMSRDDDLVSNTNESGVKASLKIVDDDDLFKNVNNSNDNDAKTSLKIVDDGDDDLFKNVNNPNESDVKASLKIVDDDGLFKNVSNPNKSDVKASLKIVDNDDLFKNVNNPKESDVKVNLKIVNDDGLFKNVGNPKESDLKANLKIVNDDGLFKNVGNPNESDVKANLKIMDDDDLFKNVNNPNDNDAKASLKTHDDGGDNLFKKDRNPKESDVEASLKTLNDGDDDIFKNVSNPNESDVKASLKIVDDDDLFKTTKSDGVKTLGQVYLSPESNKEQDLFKTETLKSSKSKKKSLFDDMSDEENELFNGAVKKKKDIFSKSEKDNRYDGGKKDNRYDRGKKDNRYDGGKKDNTYDKGEKDKKETKSLFGDSDENDDIFGVKSKIKDVKSQSKSRSNQKHEVCVNVEPVFGDPLSLFNNKDD